MTFIPAKADEAFRSAPALTLRAVVLGLLMVGVIVGLTQVFSIQRSAAEVGGGAPPPAPTYLLFLYLLLVAPLLSRLNPRLALSRGELLLIYTMMLVAGPIAHPYGIGFLLPHTVSPYYLDEQEPRWALFQPALPAWLSPQDPRAIVDFFRGTGEPVPWREWRPALVAWSSLLTVLFGLMLCINVLMRQQWIEGERLVFPLATIPLALAEGPAAPALGPPVPASGRPSASRHLLHQPLFWLGLALTLLLQAPAAIHRYLPYIPPLRLRDILLLDATLLPRPWNGLEQISFSLILWLVGVVYLLPQDVACSAWVFYFMGRLENVVAVAYGRGEAPSVYTNQFPALFAQGAGAALALTGLTLYTARHSLRRALRQALRGDPAREDRHEFLSYRTAVGGLIGGIAFILGWCGLASMSLGATALLFGLMLSYFFIFARIRAETGLGMGVILWPKMLDEMMVTFVGAQNLSLKDLTLIHSFRWLYFGSATGAVMACQMEGFKIAGRGGLRGRGVGATLALTATFTMPLAMVWTLRTYYREGFELLPIGDRGRSMVGSQIYWSYQNILYAYDEATGPQWDGLLAIGVGGGVAAILSALRVRFLWFPLHPVGYLAANSWGMHINWASFLLGWLIKGLVTRYGGLSIYRRLLPLFLGFIMGDLLHQGAWGLVAWKLGSP